LPETNGNSLKVNLTSKFMLLVLQGLTGNVR